MVGPFTTTGTLGSQGDASLFSAVDPLGRTVDLAVLTGGAGEDPAARDRFIAAAEDRFRSEPAAVLGATAHGTYAWVAFPPGRGAAELPALMPSVQTGAGPGERGPGFDPYHRGRTTQPGWHDGLAHWQHDRGKRPWWHFWWLLALFLASLMIMLLLLSRCVPPPPPPPSPSPTSGSGSGSPTSSSQSPSTSSGSSSPSSSSTTGSESASPSPNPSGSVSGSGTGTPTPTNKA